MLLITNSPEGNAPFLGMAFPPTVRKVPYIFLIPDGRKEFHLRQTDNTIFRSCSRRAVAFFAPHGNVVELEFAWTSSYHWILSLNRKLCSMVKIINLFFVVNLTNELDWIKELDLELFLTDSFVRHMISINLEMEESEKLFR